MKNTTTYFENIFKRIFDEAEKYECEINDWDETITDHELTVGIKTLAEESDPSVGYYYSGIPEIMDFIEELKKLLQINNIKFKEDVDVEYGEYDMWVTRHGWLTITI